jgi:hypothetical protein
MLVESDGEIRIVPRFRRNTASARLSEAPPGAAWHPASSGNRQIRAGVNAYPAFG